MRHTRAQQSEQSEQSEKDIAIIGVSLRFPGADSLEAFWRHLVSGTSLITEVSPERWDKARYFGNPRKEADKTNSIWGGFVEHADCFDAAFFNISPREAESMDPQQRFALELAWKAIEDAGYRPSDLAGSQTGVFMGVCHADYAELMERQGAKTDAYFPTGTAYSIISNRVSYFFDLHGPSITNDTACSSSLVSLYEAVHALHSGECGLALAGGVNLCWSPKHFVAFSQASMLSRSGECRAFDHRADGYVRGEGGAIAVLKPLAKAIEDGDPIYAVIKGVATNHGGKTSSLTVTNPKSQASLIEGLYEQTGIRPDTVSYIEAHGPGTPVGDPIEILALKRAFKSLHDKLGSAPQPSTCGLGSVKTNIGHLEGAAGIAGVVKVIGALTHRVLPASINFEKLNSIISLEGSPFYIVHETQPWNVAGPPDGPAVRRAGVSSFGFGGTNAHIVLEEHIPQDGGPAAALPGPCLVPLSAKNGERLRVAARDLLTFLQRAQREDGADAAAAPGSIELTEVAYTLQVGREAMDARVIFLVSSVADLIEALDAFDHDAPAQGALREGRTEPAGGSEALRELAQRWAQGGAVDWKALYGASRPRRVRLPSYPFARERHWFAVPAANGREGAALHPLLHQNTSDLSEQRFRSTFTGDEFFLDAHRVKGARVLPGVAYLEMVREAVEQAAGRLSDAPFVVRLQNVVWARPIAISDRPVEVQVGLFPDGGESIAFEVYGGTSARDPSALVFSQGVAQLGPADEPPAHDLEALRAACGTRIAAPQAYATFRAMGLDYGPALQGLHEVLRGKDQLLARLTLPESLTSTAGEFVLHPCLMDSALQASLLLKEGSEGDRTAGATLPFALETLEVFRACSSEMWAWVRARGAPGGSKIEKLDIDLCDPKGVVCVRLRGLVQRPIEEKVDTAARRVVAAASRWVDQAIRRSPRAGESEAVHGFVAGKAASRVQDIEAEPGVTVEPLPEVAPSRLADGVQACFELVFERVQQVLQSRPKSAHRFVVLVDDRTPRHAHAPLVGLLKTAHLENPLVSGKVVRVAGLDAASPRKIRDLLRDEGAEADGAGECRYSLEGARQVRQLAEVALDEGPGDLPLKTGGVYWLTGGLGGLGVQFARQFGRTEGVVVVVSGRSAPEAANLEALSALRDAGVRAHYLQADVAQKQDVERAVRTIVDEHGSLDGIVHAAGLIRDAYILRKDASDIRTVLDPKVRGTLNIDAASRDLDLEFLVLFSSVAGVFGNPGQADYAGANAFLDAFAEQRQALVDIGERKGRTLSISWPLWASGGMTVDAVTLESMRRQRGWEPLPTEDGLRAFGRLLAHGALDHVTVAFGAGATLVDAPRSATDQPAARPGAPAPEIPEDELMGRTLGLLKRLLGEVTHRDPETIHATPKLEEYGIDSLIILDMTSRLEALFGSLSKTLFFEYVNLQGVAAYFIEAHRDKLVSILGSAAPSKGAAESAPAEPQPSGRSDVRPRFVPRATARAGAAREPQSDYHDIAVVGLAGRYPGAETLDEFWAVMESGRHCFEEVPRDRWDHDAIYSRNREILGKTVIRTGTFLRDIDRFDPRYFRISKRDAELMSPEVRLFLQVGVEAFEDAGYSRETLQRKYGGDVGVLVGTMSNHYGLYGFQNNLTRGAPASGSYTGTLPNMLSYFYGLTGPSIFVDTMCSAASTCIHQAVQMLRSRECGMVIAGGVNLLLHPYNLISSSQEHFTTGTSDVIRSYGVGADGTILGEGVGAVVLKPLVEAERDGDHIYAVIKGTAITNAGVRNGFTVPNPHMQARAIEKAIDDAGIDPRSISYLEGHGSGTALGDPVEVKALTVAFGKYTQEKRFCALGSVKSNMGHLLAAAGIVGFTKVMLQLKEGKIAPSLHSAELNPDIAFSDTPFRVQQELIDWERPTLTENGRTVVAPRRAGITSIGAGGMNSHIIVEEYAGAGAPPDREAEGREQLMVFSAMTDGALEAYLKRFRDFMVRQSEPDLSAIASTLRVGKNELPRRWSLIARDPREVLRKIDAFLAGERDIRASLASDGGPADPLSAVMRELAEQWTAGATVDWDRLSTGLRRPPRKVSLPAYPFERVRCWVSQEAEAPSVIDPLAFRSKLHPLLGINESDVQGLRYALSVHLDDLLDYGYRLDKARGVVPTFAIDMALALASLSGFAPGGTLRHLHWSAPLDWSSTARLVSSLSVDRQDEASAVVSAEDAGGARKPVVRFDIRPSLAQPPSDDAVAGIRLDRLDDDATRVLGGAQFYEELAEGGLDYRPMLEGVKNAFWMDGERLLLEVTEPALRQDRHHRSIQLPSFVLGAILQGIQLVAKRRRATRWQRQVPHRIEEVRLFGSGFDVSFVLFDLAADSGGLAGRVWLLDGKGKLLGRLSGVRCGEDDAPRGTTKSSRRTPEAPRESAWSSRKTPEAPRESAWSSRKTPEAPREAARSIPREPEAPRGERTEIRDFVRSEIQGIAAQILKFDASEIDLGTGLDAFGFDSMSLVTFSKHVRGRFGVEVNPAVFFELHTLEKLGEHLLDRFSAPLREAWEAQATPRGRDDDRPRDREERPVRDPGSPMPIAIIGAAGRFPGAPDLATFWSNLLNEEESISPFPIGRYDAVYRRIAEDAAFPRRAGILDDVDRFDAGFFQIYPREAELMDPQHRLSLETVWSALEDSGIAPADLPKSTGLFMGVSGTDYATLLTTYGVPPDAFTSTGNAHSILVNRISYLLDIRGPSEPVDTACSSSLVAVHRAVEALRSGRCAVAIAGGVNLLLSIDTFVSTQLAGMLSPDGRCKTFSKDANGYVRGEGVGALVLKPLADAESDGDAILGVLLGTAENHGGRANSLTAPNAEAQAQLIESAMDGIDPRTISYIETHGTGTQLGDPVEIRALQAAFGRLMSREGAPETGFCGLGSVKTNIGHLESAAGIAGMMKVLLAMKHGAIPATLHCREVNPYIQLEGSPFYLVQDRQPWERRRDAQGTPIPRRAGVSSFGFGGSNAHVVIEEYVSPSGDPDARSADPGPCLIPLSARTEAQLEAVAQNLLAFLQGSQQPPSLRSIAWTLQVGREALEERLGWIVGSREELITRLRAYLDDRKDLGGGVRGRVARKRGGLAVQRPDDRLASSIQTWFAGRDLKKVLEVWTEGFAIDWRALHGAERPRKAHLPTYPFSRERYWIPGAEAQSASTRPVDADDSRPAAREDTRAVTAHEATIGTVILQPRWKREAPSPAAKGEHGRRLVVVCEELAAAQGAVERRLPDVRCVTVVSGKERIENRFQRVSQQVFESVREVLEGRPTAPVLVQVAVPAGGEQVVYLALAGLLRSARLENPRLHGQVIGVEDSLSGEALVDLLEADARSPEHDLIRYRGGERCVLEWTEAPPVREPVSSPWRAGGVYLITGGGGGIGAIVAREIVERVGRATLVLVGRSPIDERLQARLAELRALGAEVRYRRANLSRWEEVRHLVQQTRDELGELHGVIHAAGVIRDSFITQKTADAWDEVLAPKVAGLVNLDRATRQHPLDFMLLFSSGAAITGNPGQADYATANGFVDAYAAYRNAQVEAGACSGRTMSIAWPLWKDGGMQVDAATRAMLWQSRGLHPMETAHGIEALYRAWASGGDRVWIHHGDVARARTGTSASAIAAAPRARDGARVDVSPALLREGTLRQLKGLFAQITKLGRDAIDAEESLDAGRIDSIMVAELNQQLARVFGEISKTLFYEYTTLRAIAEHLVAEHPAACARWIGADAAPGARAAAAPAAAPAPPRAVAAPHKPPPLDEPIAIIGMSGRYPKADNLDQYWENLKAGRDCIDEVPSDRWSLDGFFEPDLQKALATGRSYSKWGGFINDFAAFDPLFFQIAPREALAMDPQERLFLQACWEVLEDAGYSSSELARRHQRRVGVFAGVTKAGHGRHGPVRTSAGETVVPRNASGSVAARASYVLDLRGPSLPVDTMCSSSLTAIHEACEHIRQGACELAIAGGVNLYLHPVDYIELCQSTMLSADGRCRSFGSGGHGFVPGEGVGCVLLKPLSRALADGDRIYAVVRATSINHGGRSNGYTVPNPVAQSELIRTALDRAGISARAVSYVEAHGTGTELGDPIEITGLKRAFEQDTPDKQFCAIGSSKSAIGHLEAAAGIAGVTRVVLQMQHKLLAPSLHAEKLNPNIPFEQTPFVVQRTLTGWERPVVESAGVRAEHPRIACVSSFGAGGANAHVILEEHIPQAPAAATRRDAGPQIIVLSARSLDRLRAYAERLLAFLERGPVNLADLAFTLQVGREAMRERLAVVAGSQQELLDALRGFLGDDLGFEGAHRGTVRRKKETLAALSEDAGLQELMESWIRSGNLTKIVTLWVDGVEVDWHRLYGESKPRRISLPTYPFTRDRLWIGELSGAPVSRLPAPVTVTERDAEVRSPVRAQRRAPQAALPAAPVAAPRAEVRPAVPIEDYVRQTVLEKLSSGLGMDLGAVDSTQMFADYGLDSILGLRFVHELNEALSLDLPNTIIYDHSSADRLSAFLLSRYRDAIKPRGPAPAEPLAEALAEQPAERPAQRAPSSERSPIAIIGMSGRFAGSSSLDELWGHLASGDDLVREVTRWDLASTLASDKPICTQGGLLEGIDQFDPLFFNISGLEAACTDPQQRLLLEEAWKALEDAGHAARQRLDGQRCGVYVGCWAGDYHQSLVQKDAPAQALWGNMASVVPGRVSYFLNLKGPAIAVDTSCSSSLVALHLACKDLWAGETTMALAGGVFVQTTPRLYQLATRAGMLSPTGRCHTFDREADGFVPGEGVGVVVLKRLEDALADGDHIYGVIRGTGINHDGATNGITAPSAASQERLLREVYETFGVDVERIQMVEAHGTGTKLGDPIEVQALTRAFQRDTDKTEYCAIGSIKTNLGHAQFAAGVAGVLKILLAMKHKQLPPSLHFKSANEAIPFRDSPFYVNTRLRTWDVDPGAPRCAVVSSFGASGTNAHLVIEEAPAGSRRSAARPAYLIVLSARTREQLSEQVQRLAAHCRRARPLDCGSVAYTLLVGREHFAHRFACVVRDGDELLRCLDEGLESSRAFVSSEGAEARGEKASMVRLGSECIRRCGELARPEAYGDDLKTIAGLFVQGLALDYGGLFAEGAYFRVPLPTYPFARESYWTSDAAESTSADRAAGVRSLHPMVHENSATLREHRFTSVFTGREFFLADHVVRGRHILPGVASLEMARAAAVLAAGLDPGTAVRLRNVAWAQPLVVEDKPARVHLGLQPEKDGSLSFEIAAEGTSWGADRLVFCQGQVSWGGVERPPSLDLRALRARCTTQVSPDRIDAALTAMDIHHGPALRAIDEAFVGPGLVLAKLSLPAAAPPAGGPFVLHPSLMDASIQAAIALQLASGGGAAQETAVPFALDQLEVLAPCPASMWAVVRTDERGAVSAFSRLDIDLVDASGAVCVRMTGYSSRQVEGRTPSLFVPVWDAVPTPRDARSPAAGQRALIVGGSADQRTAILGDHPDALSWDVPLRASVEEILRALQAQGPIEHLFWIAPPHETLGPADADGFIAAQDEGVLSCFRMIKALLQLGYDARPLGWTVVTEQCQATHAQEATQPAHAGLHGLVGSLAKEYTGWSVRLVDLESGVWPGAELYTLPPDPRGDAWVHRGRQWHQRRWIPCEIPGPRESLYRNGGVYVVIGGAGGLGTAWSEYMLDRFGAHLVWIGRRGLDRELDDKLRSLRARGDVHYISADAADPEALGRAYREIKARHPRIHGLIHAALVLRDQSLAKMDEPTFRAAFSAKVDASVQMARVFADEPLDFVTFFSSIQSFTTAPGQSNYAAGCTFSDAFAHFLSRHWPCAVRVMNWGWWGSLGSVSAEFYRQRMTQAGLASIEPPEAMAGLELMLSGPHPQVSLVKMTRPDALEAIDPGQAMTVYPQGSTSVAPAVLEPGAAPRADQELLRAAAAWRATERDPLLAQMLRGHLQSLGLVGDTSVDIAARRARAGIPDRYIAWLDQSLSVVDPSPVDMDALWAEWDRRLVRWSTDPDKKAEAALVDATLRALPDILTGKTRPTDILFPRGSVALVEGVYRNNRVADAFNRALTDAAVTLVRERIRQDAGARIRILEIGAGTGGTSVGVFAGLRPYREHIETYTYTDLSKAFLNHAQTTYGPQVPYLTCQRFDVEQPLRGQGIAPSSFDLVIAANVLHATRDTRNTLRNAKAALRNGGWLLLNELAVFDLFSHLTFGLLEGWWLFEDKPLRIPGSPALSPDGWREVLETEGFRSVVFVLPEAHDVGQQVIAAESDGVARQKVAGRSARPQATAPAQAPAPNAEAQAPAPKAESRAPSPAAPPPEARITETLEARTMRYLRDRAAATLKIPADKIKPSAPLTDYGMDSILVLQLTSALRADLGEIPATLLFEVESIDALTAHFIADRRERLAALLEVPKQAPPAAAAPSASHRLTIRNHDFSGYHVDCFHHCVFQAVNWFRGQDIHSLNDFALSFLPYRFSFQEIDPRSVPSPTQFREVTCGYTRSEEEVLGALGLQARYLRLTDPIAELKEILDAGGFPILFGGVPSFLDPTRSLIGYDFGSRSFIAIGNDFGVETKAIPFDSPMLAPGQQCFIVTASSAPPVLDPLTQWREHLAAVPFRAEAEKPLGAAALKAWVQRYEQRPAADKEVLLIELEGVNVVLRCEIAAYKEFERYALGRLGDLARAPAVARYDGLLAEAVKTYGNHCWVLRKAMLESDELTIDELNQAIVSCLRAVAEHEAVIAGALGELAGELS